MEKRYKLKRDIITPDYFYPKGMMNTSVREDDIGLTWYVWDAARMAKAEFTESYMDLNPNWFEEVENNILKSNYNQDDLNRYTQKEIDFIKNQLFEYLTRIKALEDKVFTPSHPPQS